MSVANPTGPRILGAKLEVPIGPGLVELAIPSLRKGAELDQQFAIPTVRRGVVPVGPVRTIRADPIGLVRRELIWTEAIELIVHPRTIGGALAPAPG